MKHKSKDVIHRTDYTETVNDHKDTLPVLIVCKQNKGKGHISKGGTYKTVIGDRAYDKKGDVTRADYVMYTWKKDGDKIKAVQN